MDWFNRMDWLDLFNRMDWLDLFNGMDWLDWQEPESEGEIMTGTRPQTLHTRRSLSVSHFPSPLWVVSPGQVCVEITFSVFFFKRFWYKIVKLPLPSHLIGRREVGCGQWYGEGRQWRQEGRECWQWPGDCEARQTCSPLLLLSPPSHTSPLSTLAGPEEREEGQRISTPPTTACETAFQTFPLTQSLPR